jgi:hypothetical protein
MRTIDEEQLPALQRHLLLHIRKYGPLLATELRDELRTMRAGGADMRGLNENEIPLAIAQLERDGLILAAHGGWVGNFETVELQVKQKNLLF